jgi:hypothetical protein
MAEVTRNQFTELIKKDMYLYGIEAYENVPSVYDKIFEVRPSDAAFENKTNAIGMGKLSEKKEGEKIVFSNPLEGFTIYTKNRTFGDGVEYTFETVEDAPKEKVANMVRDFAKTYGDAYIRTKEQYAARIFNEGGLLDGSDIFNATITGIVDDPTGDFVFDNKPFFNLSNNLRPLYKGGPGVKYNGLALALTSPNLQTAYNLMTIENNRNSRNEIVAVMPDTLLIPPSLRFTAKTILETEKIIGSNNNDINVTQNLITPVEWHYLTDPDAWFLGAKNMGLVWYDRMPLTFDFWQDMDTKGYKATVIARWGVEVNDWRWWTGSNFQTE